MILRDKVLDEARSIAIGNHHAQIERRHILWGLVRVLGPDAPKGVTGMRVKTLMAPPGTATERDVLDGERPEVRPALAHHHRDQVDGHLIEQSQLQALAGDRAGRDAHGSIARDGLRLVDRVAPEHVANERRLLAALSDDEQRALAGSLRKLLATYEREHPAPPHGGRGGRHKSR